MKWLKQRLIMVVLFMFATTSVHLFADKKPLYALDTEIELWQLKLTGDTVGDFRMQLKRVKTGEDSYEISGKFFGPMKDRSLGNGKMNCRLRGKLEKNAFKADLYGSSVVSNAFVTLKGKVRGTIINAQGSGTYSVIHDFGSPRGEWTLKRITSSQ